MANERRSGPASGCCIVQRVDAVVEVDFDAVDFDAADWPIILYPLYCKTETMKYPYGALNSSYCIHLTSAKPSYAYHSLHSRSFFSMSPASSL